MNIQLISQNLSIPENQIQNTINLLQEGATIPFISRYRKEVTGGLDEVQIGDIKKAYEEAVEFEKRKEFILDSIEKQGKLTEQLKSEIEKALDIQTLEDLYLPYKQKKKTKATVAKEKGLEPRKLPASHRYSTEKHTFISWFVMD